LDFVIKARKVDLNQLFISTQNHKEIFIKGLESTIKKLNKLGIPEEAISDGKYSFIWYNLSSP